ncbi:Protein VACUOLELESS GAMETOPHYTES [Cardamine amara subsp. amara]|uniref:Protein VACUOLELESS GAMETOPHYTES n=1 Tax=Cardamine amara subsp. amara TaxID=228776 RepID=A0ABD0ZBM6_CARAN
MDYVGGFHEVEKNGNLFQLVYHHPKYDSIEQKQSPTSSGEAVSDDHLLQPLFLCPRGRWYRDSNSQNYSMRMTTFPLISHPEYAFSTKGSFFYHPVLPLFWCNNKEFDIDGGCSACRGSNSGTNYYFCDYCDDIYHKECVQSPLKIKHPYHPEHSLQLYFHPHPFLGRITECFCCGRRANSLVYHCTICQAFIHPICAMKPILFVIEKPKTHNHLLTFFPRQNFLICNVCGLLKTFYPTYVCLRCNFVAHNDCMYAPHIIKISRHHHRISYISFLQSGESSCGVCRKNINGGYGAYTCEKCNDYVVHPRCALGKDVWNGEELEGVPEEDDITQDVGSFNIISKGVIMYFLHGHQLRLEVNKHYDENKLCRACALQIYEDNFYSCLECEFILHETCAKIPRRLHHALHPHPLTLQALNEYHLRMIICNACGRGFGGFVYGCHIGDCDYDLHVRCASISEPFDYKGHEHPLFLALDPVKKPICHFCKSECLKQLNCIKCDFIVCIKCATLPYRVKYKHDTHFLTILYGKEIHDKDWCEVCERNLKDTGTKVFYWCNECCTTFHRECLFW